LGSPKSEYLGLIYLKLATGYLKIARWQKAKQYLHQLIKEFPGSFEAHRAKQLLAEKQYYAVQVGAFLNRNHADKLVSELSRRGEYAYIIEMVDRQGRKFYRVRVGKLALLDEAEKLKSKLTGLGYPTHIFP